MNIVPFLPPLQAALNMTAAGLVGAAYYHIRKGNRKAHKACMIAALAVSALFLTSYFYYHNAVGYVPFAGQGLVRPFYFFILFSHILLAALIVPLILVTVGLMLRHRHEQHRRLARWTLPIWMYVSLTGVLIYLFAFQIYPPEQ